MTDETQEVVPQYHLRPLEEDGVGKLNLEVALPGVQSAAEIEVVVTDRSISVRVPGRFRLELPLGLPVTEKPQSVKFVRRKSLLRAILLVEDASAVAQPSSVAACSDGQENEPPTLHTGDAPRRRTQQPPPFQFAAPAAPEGLRSLRQPSVQQHGRQPAAQHASRHVSSGGSGSTTGPAAAPGMNGHVPQQPSTADVPATDPADVPDSAAVSPSKAGTALGQAPPPAAGQRQRSNGMKRGFFGAAKPSAKQGAPAHGDLDACASGTSADSNGSKATAGSGGNVDSGASTAAHEDRQPQADGPASEADAEAEGPATPSPSTPQAPQLTDDDIYEAAKVRQNQEAAAAFAEKTKVLLRAGDLASVKRAIALLEKAARLAPGLSYQADLDQAVDLADRLRSQGTQPPGQQQAQPPPQHGASFAGAADSPRSPPPTRPPAGTAAGAGGSAFGGGASSSFSGAGRDMPGAGPSNEGWENNSPVSPTASSSSRFSDDEQSAGATPRWEPRGAQWGTGDTQQPGQQRPGTPQRQPIKWWWTLTEEEMRALPVWKQWIVYAVLVLVACCLLAPPAAKFAWYRSLWLFESFAMLTPMHYFGGKRRGRWLQDTLIVGGPAAWAVRTVALAFYGTMFEMAPGLFLWPFHLVSALWVWFVWRPTWYAAAIGTGIIWAMMNVEVIIGLLIGYPAMLWAIGGRWWGLIGIALHLTLLLKGVFTVPRQLHGFLVTWTLFAWACSLRMWLALPAIIFVVYAFYLNQTQAGDSSAGMGPKPKDTNLPRPEVPEGATGEVARVLGAATHYQVLEIPQDADDAAIKRAKRDKLLATHPDKLGANAVGANLAVGRVTEALDVLTDRRTRRLYDGELRVAARLSEAFAEQEATFADSASFVMSDNQGNPMLPTATDIPMSRARQCDLCRGVHPARNHDAWVSKESGFLLGDSFRMLTCQDDKVWDITDWAVATGALPHFNVYANSHTVPMKIAATSERGRRGDRGPPATPKGAAATPPGPRGARPQGRKKARRKGRR